MYGLLADLMVAVHVGYVAYVVVGQILAFGFVILGRALYRSALRRARRDGRTCGVYVPVEHTVKHVHMHAN